MSESATFWQSISEMTFKDLMEISTLIAESAETRTLETEFNIYDPAQFAEMLSDYAEAYLESLDG